MTSKHLVDISDDWRKAQVEIMLRSTMGAQDGILVEDEDLIDMWETKIPTWMKLNAILFDKRGNRIDFIEEWEKLVPKPSEPQVESRKRILKKSILITDILHFYNVWMKVFPDKSPEKEGNFNKPWKDKSNDTVRPSGGPEQ